MSKRLFKRFCLIVGVLLLLVCHQPINAQESNTLIISSGVGFNFAIPLEPMPVGFGPQTATSNSFSLFYKRKVGKSYYLSTGVTYARYAVRTETPIPESLPEYSVSHHKTSIFNLPIHVGKKLFKHFFIETGPILSFHMDPQKHSFPEDQTGLGWSFAMGAEIDLQPFHILIKPSYKVNNVTLDDSYDRLTDLGINVGVGYSF